MNLRKHLRNNPEPHTGALNDILFILLLFFLIVSTLANPNVIKVSQPKAKSDTKAKQTVVVSIDANNNFFVGTQAIAENALKESLKPILQKEKNETPSIVINADKTTDVDKVVFVMNVAKELNAKTVLAVKKP